MVAEIVHLLGFNAVLLFYMKLGCYIFFLLDPWLDESRQITSVQSVKMN